jgi:general secretion pathway protein G
MMRVAKGFTLVEILIVVVILGILAAIVIPQFTEASGEAKESRLMQDLQSVRAQIELYKLNHNGDLPGSNAGTTWVQAMTGYTDQYGAIDANGPGTGVYGPYLQKVPTNPYVPTGVAGDSVNEGTASTNAQGPGDDTSGWYFNTSGGFFHANDSAHNTW